MNDDILMNQLRSLSTDTDTAISTETVRADVARGRSAVRRSRYTRSVSTLGVLAVAGVLTATMIDATTSHPTRGPNADTPASQTATPSTSEAAGMRLVAYTGPQKGGYTVTKVPAGYRVVAADNGNLLIGGPGDSGAHPDEYTDRIVVSLLSADATPVEGDDVRVNGQPGSIGATADNDGSRFLDYLVDGRYVQLQAWSNITLSDAELVELAESITVPADAVGSVG